MSDYPDCPKCGRANTNPINHGTMDCRIRELERDLRQANAVIDAINTLRKYGSIYLHANNQEVLDHNGHETIGVSASTPEWFDREFTGATLLEALTKAVEAKERKGGA